MLSLIAAMLAGAAQAPTADVQATNLPGLFQATCLDGQAKLRAGDVSPISFDQLPAGLRESLGHPASGKVWQLNAAGQSYLYMLDYNPGPGISPKVCGVASDSMNLKSAGDALEARVMGSVNRNRLGSAQWLNPKDGYIATATTASTFKVLQINWLSDTDRAAMGAETAQLPQ